MVAIIPVALQECSQLCCFRHAEVELTNLLWVNSHIFAGSNGLCEVLVNLANLTFSHNVVLRGAETVDVYRIYRITVCLSYTDVST